MNTEMLHRMSAEIKVSSNILNLLNVLIWGSMITEDGAADLEESRGEAYCRL